MTTIKTFHLPKQYVATLTSDVFATGYYWDKGFPGSQPQAPKAFSVSTTYKIGPFDDDKNMAYQINGAGNVTLTIDYATEAAAQAANLNASTENANYIIDYDQGVWHKIIFTENVALEFRFPEGKVSSMVLELVDAGGITITWNENILFAGGAAPTLTETGTDLLTVMQDETGNQYALVVGLDVKAV